MAYTVQIDAPHFCAGLVLERQHIFEDHNTDARVQCAAPIVKYMKGWSLYEVKHYCDKKGWRWRLYEK